MHTLTYGNRARETWADSQGEEPQQAPRSARERGSLGEAQRPLDPGVRARRARAAPRSCRRGPPWTSGAPGLGHYTADVSVAGQAVMIGGGGGGDGVGVGRVSAVSQVSPQGRDRAAGVDGVMASAHTSADTDARPSTVLAPTSVPHLES